MNTSLTYQIFAEIAATLVQRGEMAKPLPESPDPEKTLEELGVDFMAFSEIVEAFKDRFGGKDFHLTPFMVPQEYYYLTLGKFLESVSSALQSPIKNPIVVYVDDEEENIFIFKRKFGKRLTLKTFTNPTEALSFIKTTDDVALVITDEVMPNLNGNVLCDEVHKAKPLMKFILITGNPNSDGDLMYRSLRTNRFYDFINKPLDFDARGEDYYGIIRKAMDSLV
ncbi:MAG: response regulator [Fibrobacteria bacterium]